MFKRLLHRVFWCKMTFDCLQQVNELLHIQNRHHNVYIHMHKCMIFDDMNENLHDLKWTELEYKIQLNSILSAYCLIFMEIPLKTRISKKISNKSLKVIGQISVTANMEKKWINLGPNERIQKAMYQKIRIICRILLSCLHLFLFISLPLKQIPETWAGNWFPSVESNVTHRKYIIRRMRRKKLWYNLSSCWVYRLVRMHAISGWALYFRLTDWKQAPLRLYWISAVRPIWEHNNHYE